MILTRKQEEALRICVDRFRHNEPYTCISGYAGSGKAQPVDTIIPTPKGNIKLGELQIGDYVFDRLGKPTKILNIYPQGQKEKYKVVLADGRETICAGDHLWSYYTYRGDLTSKTVQEMLDNGLKTSNGFKYKIPVNKPVQYTTKQYEVDPYLMGVFLGDGCCKERYLTISSETEEIPNLIGEIIDAKPVKNSETNYNWTFEWINKTKTVNWIGGNGAQQSIERKKPKTLDYFKKYENYLMQYSYEKDIPPEYKYGDIEQRLALIQGLMDTDGTISDVDNHRYNMRFTSTSLKLVKSLQEILFSLGYSSTIHVDKREKKYTNGVCYNLNINIPNEEKYKFFRLKRKKDIALEAQQYTKRKDYSKISIVDIIPLKETTEMVCIYVDNPEHLYLTNNYIVTHNTTVVKFIIAALGLAPEEVAYVAFTGKAATVLAQKGCQNATTAHKLLYKAKQLNTGKYIFEPVKSLKPELKLIVVDEVSMLPLSMWNLLLTHHIPVVALGDPGQLPPVSRSEDNHVLDKPHIFLDEIMRQAQESEIIRFSMHLRDGRPPSTYQAENKEVMVVPEWQVTDEMLLWADQILCATNKKRNYLNNKIRELKGFGPEPQIGDCIIGLHNQWDFIADGHDEMPLTNGTIGTITKIVPDKLWVPPYINKTPIPILWVDMEAEDGHKFSSIPIDYNSLKVGEKLLTEKQEYLMKKNKKCADPPFDFAYGNAITTWKFQGSQAERILGYEESHPYDKIDHMKYLYTLCTRASERLILVKK